MALVQIPGFRGTVTVVNQTDADDETKITLNVNLINIATHAVISNLGTSTGIVSPTGDQNIFTSVQVPSTTDTNDAVQVQLFWGKVETKFIAWTIENFTWVSTKAPTIHTFTVKDKVYSVTTSHIPSNWILTVNNCVKCK